MDSVNKKQKKEDKISIEELDAIMNTVLTGEGLTNMQKARWKDTKYRDKLIMDLVVYTELKLKDIHNMNISSFDLDQKMIRVENDRGKTIELPIDKNVADSFCKYMEHERNRIKGVAPESEDALFLTVSAVNTGPKWKRILNKRQRLSSYQMGSIIQKYIYAALDGRKISISKLSVKTKGIRK